MAIHPTVLHSPDRRWRITASPDGRTITVEHDGLLVNEYRSLTELHDLLAEFGISLADLIED